MNPIAHIRLQAFAIEGIVVLSLMGVILWLMATFELSLLCLLPAAFFTGYSAKRAKWWYRNREMSKLYRRLQS